MLGPLPAGMGNAPLYEYSPRPLPAFGFDAEARNYKLVKFRGVYQNPTFRMAALEELVATFETRFHDVFICTYPKCGTTWMQQICHLLVHGGEQGDRTMYSTCPWLETLVADPILHEREACSYSLEDIHAMPKTRPRFFKSHACFKDLPRGKAPVKTIIVSRNPKDTCVSLWHHAREKPEFNLNGGAPIPGSDGPPPPVEVCPDFDDWVKLFLAGEVECGSWFHFTLEWYAASLQDPDILFLRYEDLVKDPAQGILRVANFIGIGREGEVIAKAVENSSMSAMKTKSGVYAGNVRKGGAGGWRKKITGETNKLFDQVYREQMAGSGLTFDFGEGLIM
uniref:Sulfotransferase domain-containing protein n=1 Tax=Rhizochromulina marina TaxID=1034831 RepID=A0A7S2W4G1_9STRA|mmetsp:Transcript_13486/g.39269  ORF Transcript_13486/g.39269 Transcript_13486/m.39269 type:complete len:337 (+) Transcript_13486:72-1082(+)